MGALGTFLRRRGRDRHRARVAKGRAAERRVLQIIQRLGLAWVVSARRATTKEDRRGVDIVVATQVDGDIRLQVKSSPIGAQKFEERGRQLGRAPIRVVIAGVDDDDNTVRGRVLAALILAREEAQTTGTLETR